MGGCGLLLFLLFSSALAEEPEAPEEFLVPAALCIACRSFPWHPLPQPQPLPPQAAQPPPNPRLPLRHPPRLARPPSFPFKNGLEPSASAQSFNSPPRGQKFNFKLLRPSGMSIVMGGPPAAVPPLTIGTILAAEFSGKENQIQVPPRIHLPPHIPFLLQLEEKNRLIPHQVPPRPIEQQQRNPQVIQQQMVQHPSMIQVPYQIHQQQQQHLYQHQQFQQQQLQQQHKQEQQQLHQHQVQHQKQIEHQQQQLQLQQQQHQQQQIQQQKQHQQQQQIQQQKQQQQQQQQILQEQIQQEQKRPIGLKEEQIPASSISRPEDQPAPNRPPTETKTIEHNSVGTAAESLKSVVRFPVDESGSEVFVKNLMLQSPGWEIIPATQYDITHLFKGGVPPRVLRPLPLPIPVPQETLRRPNPHFVVKSTGGDSFSTPILQENEGVGLEQAQKTSFLTHSHLVRGVVGAEDPHPVDGSYPLFSNCSPPLFLFKDKGEVRNPAPVEEAQLSHQQIEILHPLMFSHPFEVTRVEEDQINNLAHQEDQREIQEPTFSRPIHVAPPSNSLLTNTAFSPPVPDPDPEPSPHEDQASSVVKPETLIHQTDIPFYTPPSIVFSRLFPTPEATGVKGGRVEDQPLVPTTPCPIEEEQKQPSEIIKLRLGARFPAGRRPALIPTSGPSESVPVYRPPLVDIYETKEAEFTSRKVGGRGSIRDFEVDEEVKTTTTSFEDLVPVTSTDPPSTSTKIIKTVRVRQRVRGNRRGNGRIRQRPLPPDYAKSFPEYASPEGDGLAPEDIQEVKNALLDLKRL